MPTPPASLQAYGGVANDVALAELAVEGAFVVRAGPAGKWLAWHVLSQVVLGIDQKQRKSYHANQFVARQQHLVTEAPMAPQTQHSYEPLSVLGESEHLAKQVVTAVRVSFGTIRNSVPSEV